MVSGQNLNSSKLSCMSSLPARMRMIDSKMKELECSQHFSHYKTMGIFQDAQGQLTPQSLVRSGRILNWSELLWMSLLPASMKIRLKMKALECSQHFPHYNPMEAICCHGNQSSYLVKNLMQSIPTQMMLQIKFGYDWPTGCGDIQVSKCLHTDTQTDAGSTGILL